MYFHPPPDVEVYAFEFTRMLVPLVAIEALFTCKAVYPDVEYHALGVTPRPRLPEPSSVTSVVPLTCQWLLLYAGVV